MALEASTRPGHASASYFRPQLCGRGQRNSPMTADLGKHEHALAYGKVGGDRDQDIQGGMSGHVEGIQEVSCVC